MPKHLNIYIKQGIIIQSYLILVHQILIIKLKKSKLLTIVEGDLKAPFSIATTPRCRGGRCSFTWIALLYPWSVPYNTEC